jgi:predicted Zn finger-like uncharacterized protein
MTLAPQSTMVTRCPKCGTAFRITSTQLESAKGAVRCGSCLHVFKAQSNLVNKPEAAKPGASKSTTEKTTAPAQPTPTTKAVPKPTPLRTAAVSDDLIKSKTASKTPAKKLSTQDDDEEDMLISDDMEDRAGGKSKYDFDGYVDMETKMQANSLFDRKIKNEEDDKPKDTSDESWAESLMDDDDDIPQITVIKKVASEIKKEPEPNQEEQQQTEKNKLVFNLIDEGEKETEPSHSHNNFVLSEELQAIADASQNYQPKTNHDDKEEIINAIPVAGIFHDEDFQDAGNKRQLKIEPKIRSYDGSRSGLLKNIIPAPLELTANNIGFWYNRILWPFLVLVAALAIVLQLAYFRFDHFARVQPYRDFYAFACPVVGCTLPTLVDKKQIVTYNLVVQADDQNVNALLVDVMLLNKAGFDQPFPDLLLSFSDMDGNVKASRIFKPADYLGGELSGKKIMPSKQPIHLSLEIKDPKLDNYKMDVL